MPEIKRDLKPLVLAELARHGNIERACRASGVVSQTFRRWRREDEDFKRKAEKALAAGLA